MVIIWYELFCRIVCAADRASPPIGSPQLDSRWFPVMGALDQPQSGRRKAAARLDRLAGCSIVPQPGCAGGSRGTLAG